MIISNNNMRITQDDVGTAPDGTAVSMFTLTNANGILVKISNFGGIITEIHVPDKNGQCTDIVLGFDQIEHYYENNPYFGALIGRCANRIAQGNFALDEQVYQLDINNGPNHLHGGYRGFDKVVWEASPLIKENSVGLTLTYSSPDGDQHYPGNLKTTVTYQLTNNNEIVMEFHAVTDKATPVNLTQHTYFNLAGNGDVLGHELCIAADYFLPIDKVQIPTGELRAVNNSPFDFRSPRRIGEQINIDDEQLKNGLGYDHNFILNPTAPNALVVAATVHEPSSGRLLKILTDAPGLQFYSGNFLDGSLSGKNRRYHRRNGFCLEPQSFPNAVNEPRFQTVFLRPGEIFTRKINYQFSVL